MNLLSHRRGSVALMTGIMAPVMVMAVAMGIEVTSWSVTNVDLQRIADVSAWAGARQYAATQNSQTATQTAADLAEINGASGTSSRTWNPTTLTTSDNMITAQVVTGVRNATDTAVKVTVKRSIAKTLSRIFPSAQSSVTISATAIAEIVSSVAGPQPCLVAIKEDGGGVTTGTDITFSGNADVTANNCSVRSDAGIKLNGNATLNVGGTYAAGTISTSGNAIINGPQYNNAGQIPDPYLSDTPLQNAMSSSLTSGGLPENLSGGTTTINPKAYSSISVSGTGTTLIMNPGLYTVNGPISFSGNVTITGNGVTIVSSNILSVSGNASVSLTAPLSGASSGIPGIMYASNSKQSSSFSGNSAIPFAGVIYYPNGNMSFSGNSGDGSTGCSEVIAGTITISGNSNLSTTGCKPYGTVPFGSLPNSSSIALVQ